MNESTKKKYCKIFKTHNEIVQSKGQDAPHLSKSYLVNLTIKSLREQGVQVSRSVVYQAFKNTKMLRKEMPFLGD